MTGWTPDRWRGHAASQQPAWPDEAQARAIEGQLSKASPVVAIEDCRILRDAAADPRRFLLQGGDCAESFDDPVAEKVAGLAALFDRMLAAVRPALGAEPIAIGRIAGQFGKPRSQADERIDGTILPAYRGDIINGAAFTAAARAPDPRRMLRAHLQSVGASASLAAARGGRTPIFTSHEALLLPYEQALARRDVAGRWWATSGHMLWLGDRTRALDGAHVDFLSGIENLVGVKCGPTLDRETLLRLVERLDPDNRPGKLVLIGRFGAGRIERCLPPLLRAGKEAGLVVRWAIDPMHGNTGIAAGRKVRRLSDILAEIEAFTALCVAEQVPPGGIHLEMSGADVTECVGVPGPASVAELERNWRSPCDPRLNPAQAILVADRLAVLLAPTARLGLTA